MSGPEFPDTPAPEVPEEFADAYREAFQRALEGTPRPTAGPPGTVAGQPPPAVRVVGHHTASRAGRRRGPGLFLPLLVAGLSLLLIAGVFVVGKLLANDFRAGTGGGPAAVPSMLAPPTSAEPRPSTEPSPGAPPSRAGTAWEGAVTAIVPASISARCTSPGSVDSAGHRVGYDAANAIDGDPATAWRCDGRAIGERLVIRLPDDVEVAELGLVPGYAKTDPKSHVDRYAENNRITKVRWLLGHGVSVEQDLDPSRRNRGIQTIRVPRTSASQIVLQILEVQQGPRNTTAVSEIRVATAG